MLVETSAQGSDISARPRVSGGRVHDDAPDTAADFSRLAALPEGPERDAVRDRLTKAWLPMAHRIAGRFRNRGESLEDLRQVAALGLVKAIDRYEPGRGAFERMCIRDRIKRHFRDRMWALRVPRRIQELRNKVRVARRDLAAGSGGETPSVAEIAAHAGLTEEEVNAGLEALESFSTLSLDAEMSTSDDGFSLADTIGTCDEAFDVVIDREAAKEGLRRLPERERAILYMRFFEDMTQSRIAERLGISQMHVSRLISRCCAQVREQALDQGSRPGSRAGDGRTP